MTIIDAGLRKQLDLQVLTPVERFGPLPERTVWPSIYRLLAEHIQRHRSTIIFANNRRSVERITAMLNEHFAESDGEPIEVRAHHGSISLEVRRQTEEAIHLGIFGAPTFVSGAELFWGNDRFEEAIEWHKAHTVAHETE